MRVQFAPPTIEEFILLLNSSRRKAGSLSDIRIFNNSRNHIRSGGFFSYLTGLVRKAAPFIMWTLAPGALNLGQNVLNDVQGGQNIFKQPIRKRGIESLKGVGRQLVGGGKRCVSKNISKKKVKKKKSAPFIQRFI